MNNLPAHGALVHKRSSRPSPSHFLPPFLGLGELHDRTRVSVPLPQVTRHDHGVHLLHPPSMISTMEIKGAKHLSAMC